MLVELYHTLLTSGEFKRKSKKFCKDRNFCSKICASAGTVRLKIVSDEHFSQRNVKWDAFFQGISGVKKNKQKLLKY